MESIYDTKIGKRRMNQVWPQGNHAARLKCLSDLSRVPAIRPAFFTTLASLLRYPPNLALPIPVLCNLHVDFSVRYYLTTRSTTLLEKQNQSTQGPQYFWKKRSITVNRISTAITVKAACIMREET
eukprot:766058-Hanusia_phi.AAC.3